jgi:hypothetical protein
MRGGRLRRRIMDLGPVSRRGPGALRHAADRTAFQPFPVCGGRHAHARGDPPHQIGGWFALHVQVEVAYISAVGDGHVVPDTAAIRMLHPQPGRAVLVHHRRLHRGTNPRAMGLPAVVRGGQLRGGGKVGCDRPPAVTRHRPLFGHDVHAGRVCRQHQLPAGVEHGLAVGQEYRTIPCRRLAGGDYRTADDEHGRHDAPPPSRQIAKASRPSPRRAALSNHTPMRRQSSRAKAVS